MSEKGSLTKREQEEAARRETEAKMCSQSWRLSNLYWIEDKDGKKVKFKPREEQRELHNDLHNRTVIVKCRQPGISTYCALLMLDDAIFHPNFTGGIVDKTDPDAVKKLAKIKFAYDHLDDQDDPETALLGKALKKAIVPRASNDHELEFSNDSKIWAGTNMRGGTLQSLWWTEAGYTSFYDPKGADEIRKGAFNTVALGGRIIVESTHEGGKFGVFYNIVKLAMESPPNPGPMDWKFKFFAWHRNEGYRLEPLPTDRISEDDERYFGRLYDRGISLTPAQKNWYVKKRSEIGESAMMKEFPSLEEECFEAVVAGAIYGKQITALRAKKRIVDFEHDRTAPLFCFWDLGFSDFTAIWLVQFVGREIHALSARAGCREVPQFYVNIVRFWEVQYEAAIRTHFLPHDADAKELSGKSYRDYLRDAGVANTKTVIRTPDTWLGINHLRSLLPRFYFHKTECGREWMNGGRTMPSGISALECYHTKEDGSSGIIRETPDHDQNSHMADALRTLAEAHMRGLLEGGTSAIVTESAVVQQPRVILAGYNAPRGGWNMPHYGGPTVVKM